MLKKGLSKMIIVSLLLTMIVPNFVFAAGNSSLIDDFTAKTSVQVVKNNIYSTDLLDVCYYSSDESFYAIGEYGTVLRSSDGDHWDQVTDIEIAASEYINFVDMYCSNNQIAAVGTDVNGDHFIVQKKNADAFSKTELIGAGTPQAVAISGSSIVVTTNTGSYYHSEDGGTTWAYSQLHANSTGSTAVTVDFSTDKFMVYNNSNTEAYQYYFERSQGNDPWTRGTITTTRFSTVKNIYKTSTEWLVLMNNGTTSAMYRTATPSGGVTNVAADYMMEAAYTTGSVEANETNIIVGWKADPAGDRMIIRSTKEPGYTNSYSNDKLHRYSEDYNTRAWVGNGRLYGIAAGVINGSTVYVAVGSDGSILKSTNGYQFAPVAQEIDAMHGIKHMIAADDVGATPGQQVVVTDDNRVYYSNDRGVTWNYAYKLKLTGEVVAMKYASDIWNNSRLHIATNNSVTNNATSYRMMLPNVDTPVSLADFTIRGATSNASGIVYYGTTPSTGIAKMVSQNNNASFQVSTSSVTGDIQLTINYPNSPSSKFALNGNSTHNAHLGFQAYNYNISPANGSGSLNGAINRTYVANAEGNDRQLIMDESGYVRVFTNPTTTSTMYTDTLIYVGQGIPLSASFELKKLLFVNGLFVALGTDGDVYTSIDGIVWAYQSDLSSTDYVDIAKSNSSLFLLGKYNTIDEVSLSYNPYSTNTFVNYPNPVITAPATPGPYDGTQVGVNEITVDTTNDPNAAGTTQSYRWFNEDAQEVKHQIAGQTSNKLDLSVLSAGYNRIYVEVTYTDNTKVDQQQSTRMYGAYSYQINIPNYDIDVDYSATSFNVVEGYNVADVTPITITVTNTGDTDIPYLQISSTPVVVASLDAYAVAVGETITGQVVIAANKPIGSYSTDVNIQSPYGSIVKTQTITYQVTDVPSQELDAQVDRNYIQLAHNYASPNDAKVELTLNNTGNRDIETLSVTLSDNQNFELSTVPARIEVGDSEIIDITPKVALEPGRTYEYDVTIVSEAGTVTRSVTIVVDDTPLYDMTLTPVKTDVTISDDYTNASDGELVVSMTNSGNRDLTDLVVDLQGADSGSFTLNTVSSNLSAGDSVSVIATPNANLPIGVYNVILTVESASNNISKTQALKLTVTDVPVYNMSISLDKNRLDLEHGYTTNDGKIIVTLQNDGNRPESPIVSVSDAAVLAVGTVPTSIAANSSDSFEITVNENVSAASYSVTLGITTAAGQHTETIVVHIEPAPTYEMSVTADRTQANLPYNYTDASNGKFVLTALNTGNQAVQNISIELSDVRFTAGTIRNELAAGEDMDVEITPSTGLTAGTYPVTVTFRADQMSPQVVELTVIVASAPVTTPTPTTRPVTTPTPGPVATPTPTSSPTTTPTTSPAVTPTPRPVLSPTVGSQVVPVINETTAERLEQLGAEIVGQAVELAVTWTNEDGEEVELNEFDTYVEYTLSVNGPFTTAIFIDEDGTIHHVPTQTQGTSASIFVRDNGVYALINYQHQLTDISGHWAEASITNLANRLIVNGQGNSQFDPDGEVTRAEFASMMVRALGLAKANQSIGYSDTAEDAWYYQDIQTASAHGLIKGYTDGTYRPNDRITREQAMVIIARAAGLTNLADASANEVDLSRFIDAFLVSGYAENAVQLNVDLGLVIGKTATTLAPQDHLTRAEVAVIIERLLVNSKLIDDKKD